MVCVYCGSATHVVNSRQQRRSNDIWRRRKCTKCGNIFTSTENADLGSAIRVELVEGRLVPFDRSALFISLYESCKHRPTAARDAANLTQQITARLLTAQDQPGLITRLQIVRTCHAALEPFDATAAMLYAAYHPE